MEFFTRLIHLIRNLGDDNAWRYLIDFIGQSTLYVVLFGIIFCETGLVIWPFLPGDSLLFAAGAMVARNIGLSLPMLIGLLILAALLGDNLNYWIGRRIGPAIFSRENSRLLNKVYLNRAQSFYEKYGRKTIILARFVPIVRTFAPFVAGIGRMSYATFLTFSVIGAVAWVNLCVLAGYTLGGREFFKKHFELVVVAIVVISLLPMFVEFLRHRAQKKQRGFEVNSESPGQ